MGEDEGLGLSANFNFNDANALIPVLIVVVMPAVFYKLPRNKGGSNDK